MEISEVQAVRPVRLTQLQGPSSQVPSAQRLSSAAASPTATEPPAATRLEQHRARGCVPTAHEEPHTRDSSQITPVRADKGQASGTCHSGLALRAALAARLPVRRAAPRALASPPRASIAAGGSFEACAVRETGPDPAGCSRAGPGKAGPPGPRPAARPALTGSHEGIGPARRRAGPPRGRAAGEAPRDRRGGRRRASRADAQRKAARDRPRCIGGWGREGGSGTRAGLTHAAAATHRSFARCRLLPTAPPRPIPALGGSRGRGQWDGGPQGGALLLAGGGGGPPRAAAMAGCALAALLPAVLRPRGRTHVCQRGERGVWRRGEPVPAEAPVWDAERLRGITARVNLVLSVWGYCEIIASPG